MALRRSDLTLWVAWVAAAAIATLIQVWMSTSASDFFSHDLVGASTATVVYAVPLAIFQYVILRRAVGVSLTDGGLWLGFSLLAAGAHLPAVSSWYQVVIPAVTGWTADHISPDAAVQVTEQMIDADLYIVALLVGIAQGLVLERMLRRTRAAVVWVVANVLATAVAASVTNVVAGAFPAPPGAPFWLLAEIDFGLAAALTGAALVAMVRLWWPPSVRGLAPAAR